MKAWLSNLKINLKSKFSLKNKNNTRCYKSKSVIKDKKAVLIGLNYPGSYYALNGCVNDVKNAGRFLTKRGYDVKALFDKDITDKYNVLEALNELKNSPSKTVFFHYSGHGSQTADLNGDEKDGFDEVVYSKNGVTVTDDDIFKVLQEFPKDKTVFLVFDCCHSASISDLPYILTNSIENPEKYKNDRHVNANIICVSGCQDYDVSADITDKGVSYGALSSCLFNLLREHENDLEKITWRKLYIELLYDMVNKGYTQVPSISVSDPVLFDALVDF